MDLPFSPGPPVPLPQPSPGYHHLGPLVRVLDADPPPAGQQQQQQRSRANTWPLPKPEDAVVAEPDENGGGGRLLLLQPSPQHQQHGVGDATKSDGPAAAPAATASKKNSSRRNAWGNLSYADLITQAIQSSPEYRLTLSQIYDWMVHNIPYFKDKGDSNSSAGWKNSIRHNLSLHSRFVRVQNESTGKSSWWMINPDAKPGKCARRRATSMETSKYEKKRGRVRKRAEAPLKNGLEAASAAAAGSPLSPEGLEGMFPDSPFNPTYQVSPSGYRQRTNSNASSSGRLTPIQPGKPEVAEPIPWPPPYAPKYALPERAAALPPYGADPQQAAAAGVGGDPLQDTLKMEGVFFPTDAKGRPPPPPPPLGNGYLATPYAPSPHFMGQQQKGSAPKTVMTLSRNGSPSYASGGLPQGALRVGPAYENAFSPSSRDSSLLAHLTVPTYSPSFNCAMSNGSQPPPPPPTHDQPPPPAQPQQQPQSAGMLRAALSQKEGETPRSLAQGYPPGMQGPHPGQLCAPGAIPTDIDFALENFGAGLDCNVDEVIRHELIMEGNFDTLDLFASSSSSSSSTSSNSSSSSGAAAASAAAASGVVPELTAGHLNPVSQTASGSWVR